MNKAPLSLLLALFCLGVTSCSTSKVTVSDYGIVGGQWIRGSSFRMNDCSGHLSIGSKPILLVTSIVSGMSGIFLGADIHERGDIDVFRWVAFAASAVSFWMYASSPVLDLQEGHYPYFESDEPEIRPGETFPSQAFLKYVTVADCTLLFPEVPKRRFIKIMVRHDRFITVDTKSLPH